MRRILTMVFAMLVVMAFVAFAGGQEEQAGGETKMEGFNIAFSNGLVAHSWRTQMVEGIQNEVSFYQGKGLINDFHVQHAGTDVDLQVQHIRNFINMGVDALLVDALSISALNPIMEEAQESGILVVAVDMPVSSQEVWQVRPDHVAWIENMARYVFDEMNEEGDVVYLSGIDGAPVSDLRDEGFEKALADFPNINLLSKAYGNWDPSKARQTMESVLAAHSDLDGVVTQDGQAISVVRAFEAAGRPIPAMNGEYSREFVEYWVEHLDDGFSSYAIVHGPSQVVTAALAVTVNLLQGKELKDDLPENVRLEDKTLIFGWRQEITNDNVEELYDKHIQERGIAPYLDAYWEYDEVTSNWFE